ncbi:MFS-type transporter SLC18B1-like isoform X2 [Tachypleus tridentatus]|uniref:MFS-type transporter SLC18B1-like isoform X2 n=1 Tax=Tachypleus tridentatus TaxID=6853 RepID=UPI003FD291FA
MSIIAPFFPQELPIVGVKFTFLTGVLFSGVSNILFGLLVLVESNVVFHVFCFVVRSFEALGTAAFCTASYTIIFEMFPDDVGTVFGFTETFVGIGMCLGPVIGGGLYSLGGYGLPFYILGSLVIVNIPVCWYVMGDLPGNNKTKKSESYKSLLTIPSVLAVCIVIIVSSQSQGFLDPTLEPHVRQFGVKADMVGVLFLVMSAAFVLFAPFVGWLSGKMDNKYPVMVVGLVLMTGALLFIGPSPFLSLKSTLWLSIISIVLLGVSSAIAYVPTFECLLQAAVNGGLEDDMGTYSVVCGLWGAMYSLGEFTGPSLGGMLSDLLDFPLASSVMGACSGITAIIAALPWIFCKDNSKQLATVEPDSGISETLTEEENTLLQVDEDQSKNYGSI